MDYCTTLGLQLLYAAEAVYKQQYYWSKLEQQAQKCDHF